MRFVLGTLVVLFNCLDNATTFLCLREPVVLGGTPALRFHLARRPARVTERREPCLLLLSCCAKSLLV